MRVPTAAELLELWDARRLAAPEGATPLLAAAWPGSTAADIQGLTVGARDALLMALHERLFGPRIEALAACPACHSLLETGVSLTELREAAAAGDGADTVEVQQAGFRVVARLPTAGDVASLASFPSAERAERALLERCVQAAWRDGSPVAAGDLPRDVVDALSERLSTADPLADIWLGLRCAECSRAWSARLDVERFFFAALGAWAEQTLDEVHELARAYAWSEAEILALSPARRRDYLSRVRS